MPENWLVYAIIAGVVVLFLFLLIVGLVIFFVMKKRKAKQALEQGASSQTMEASPSTEHELPAASTTNWDDSPDPAPVWQEPSFQAEPQIREEPLPMESNAQENTPEPYNEPYPPEPTSPFSTPSKSNPTSPNLSMNTAMNMPEEVQAEIPPTSNAPSAEMPMLDETGVTMDLSSYKKIIEEQLKPKSPGSIIFTTGALEGKSFEVPADGFFIGRDSHASQVVIPDPRVSKSHLWVGWKNGKVTVVDQESRNGTFINDTSSPKITEAEIKDGDVIILGEANVARLQFKAVTN